MTQATLKSTTAQKLTNSSSYGADVLHYAKLKGQQDSGPLFFATAHCAELEELQARVAYAQSRDEALRPIVLEHFASTAVGADLQREYADLKTIKERTAEQEQHFLSIRELHNQINIQTLRNLETLAGIAKLRSGGYLVVIQKTQGTNDKYACYVKSAAKDDNGQDLEFAHVLFSATQLRKLGAMKQDIAGKNTADVRKMVDGMQQGTPNVNKGNTDSIPRAEMGKVAKSLEAAIAGTVVDGKLEGVSAATRNEIYVLWAHLDATLNDAEKAKARSAFAELGDKMKATGNKPVVTIADTTKDKLVAAVKASKAKGKAA
jgi:hypothetical protein